MKHVSQAELDRWHAQGQYQKIVDAIEAIPEPARSYDLTGQLARAYNNLAQYDRALALLFSVREAGRDDSVWHFRVGYAYYHMGDLKRAHPYFARAVVLDPDYTAAKEYLSLCQTDVNCGMRSGRLSKFRSKHPYELYGNKRKKIPPISYLPEDLSAVRAHIERYFGPITRTILDPVPRDLRVDLCVCAPTAQHDYYTVSTLGMGACPMNLPPEEWNCSPERLELTITLPDDWQIDSRDEIWFWPFRWLRILAHLPFEDNGWLGYGHTILSDDGRTPFASNTRQSGLLLLGPQGAPAGATVCSLSDGQKVGFLQLIPLYTEEVRFKLDHGVRALLDRMLGIDHVVCPYRLNTCAPDILSEKPKNPHLLS